MNSELNVPSSMMTSSTAVQAVQTSSLSVQASPHPPQQAMTPTMAVPHSPSPASFTASAPPMMPMPASLQQFPNAATVQQQQQQQAAYTIANPNSSNQTLAAPQTPVSHLVSRASKDNDSNGDDTESIDSNSSRKVESSARNPRSSTTQKRNITLLTLMKADLLQPGIGVFTIEYLGHKVVGDLLETGKIIWNNQKFDSPSSWATLVKKQINPAKKSGCGWNSVKYKGKKLDKVKGTYVNMMTPKTGPISSPAPVQPEERKKTVKRKRSKHENSNLLYEPPPLPALPAQMWSTQDEDTQPQQQQQQQQQQQISTEQSLSENNGDQMQIQTPNNLLNFQHFKPTLRLDAGMSLKLTRLQSYQQHYNISISKAALAVLHFHTNLSIKCEMNGYLGGKWNPETRTLNIVEAFPCRCQNQDTEEIQTVIEHEIETAMNVKNLIKVGWYHSHICGTSNPTLRDLEIHTQFQAHHSSTHPYVMVINAPFTTPESKLQPSPTNDNPSFRIMWQLPPDAPKDSSDPVELLYGGTPVELPYKIGEEPKVTNDHLNHMKLLLDFVRERGLSVEFAAVFYQGSSFLEKVKMSVKDHVGDENLLKMIYDLLPPSEEVTPSTV